MDAPKLMHPLYLPDLPVHRLHLWIQERTRLDTHRAQRRGKQISQPNQRRMLARRMALTQRA